MKRKIILLSLMLLLVAAPAWAQFVNGGFEDGNFNGWIQGAGSNYYGGQLFSPLDPVRFLPGGDRYNMSYNRSAVVTPGLDPRTGNQLNMVYSGGNAARVNDYTWDSHVSVISQTVANWQDPNIFFAWAAVLEESHGSTDSDNFTLKLTNDTKGTTLVLREYNSYDNGPIFTKTGSWFWTDWQIEQLDVSADIGDTFTLTLLGADCPWTGHGGYVYLDGFGAAPPIPGIPVPPTLILLGSGLAGLVAYGRMRLAK
jgi:hypothetical protein